MDGSGQGRKQMMLLPAEGSWHRGGGGALGGVDGAAGTRGALLAERLWALPLPRL